MIKSVQDKKEIELLRKQGKYLWKQTHIGFQSGIKGSSWGNPPPSYLVFDSKDQFNEWFRSLQIGLAELDEVMNYCEYFVRINGNDGKYIREGKEHLVNGEWDGYHIWGNALFPSKGFDYKLMDSFKEFLISNGWERNNWFKLKQKYV